MKIYNILDIRCMFLSACSVVVKDRNCRYLQSSIRDVILCVE